MFLSCRNFFRSFFIPTFLICALLATLKSSTSYAATLGVADIYKIEGENISDGNIISADNGLFKLSDVEYDSGIIGVVSLNPAIVFGYAENPGEGYYPVVTTGTVSVKVTTSNGQIKAGDAITTSSKPGIGMKADKSGYVLGVALEDFSEANPETVGTISASLNMRFFYPGTPYRRSQFDVFTLFESPIFESPTTLVRYILAFIILAVSFASGIIYFGKIARAGIEAIGRNPLASKIIQFGVMINVAISIALVLGGVFIALLIIKL